MSSITKTCTEEVRETKPSPNRIIGHACAALSLLCCLSFWLSAAHYLGTRTAIEDLTGFQWFRIMGVAVILAAIATVLRSKLWRVALPVSLVMCFFTMYVMGS